MIALFVEAVLCREGQRVDAAKLCVGRLGDEPLDGVDGVRIGPVTAAEAQTYLELRSSCRLPENAPPPPLVHILQLCSRRGRRAVCLISVHRRTRFNSLRILRPLSAGPLTPSRRECSDALLGYGFFAVATPSRSARPLPTLCQFLLR